MRARRKSRRQGCRMGLHRNLLLRSRHGGMGEARSPARGAKGFRVTGSVQSPRWGLPVVLALAFLTVLVATSLVCWRMAARYEALFYEANAEHTQRVIDAQVSAILWQEQFAR